MDDLFLQLSDCYAETKSMGIMFLGILVLFVMTLVSLIRGACQRSAMAFEFHRAQDMLGALLVKHRTLEEKFAAVTDEIDHLRRLLDGKKMEDMLEHEG